MSPPLGSTATDAKSGYCSMCRRDSHELCASASCRCPKPRRHPRRPTSAPKDGGAPASSNGPAVHVDTPRAGRPARPAGKRKAEPDFTLVKADPPVCPRPTYRVSLVERVRPSLEQIMAEGSHDWHRVALYQGRGAAVSKGRLAKAYRTEWEWQFVWLPEVGQSAIYVRWLGTEARALP